jgi:hypothetical protein
VVAQRLEPQPGEVVPHRGMLHRHARAHLAHRAQVVPAGHAWIAAGEELVHRVLGPQDDRPHFPQRVVEVEDDRPDAVHCDCRMIRR